MEYEIRATHAAFDTPTVQRYGLINVMYFYYDTDFMTSCVKATRNDVFSS